MKHSGLDQVSRNNSKTGNVFSASFEERVGCEEEFAKKFKGLVFRFFCSLGRCRFAEWGRLPLSWGLRMISFDCSKLCFVVIIIMMIINTLTGSSS